MKNSIVSVLAIIALSSFTSNAQCVTNEANVFAFTYNGTNYELIKENKSWIDAAACAVERGAILAEIDDQAEQDAVYNEILNNSGVIAANTGAPDGGGASYVWIGGNDLGTEGEWIWDGGNTGSGAQFWQGTSSGTQVGGLFNNWGNEPDDFSGQDGLGLAITDWPLGTSGQWNDVDELNMLYFLIEFPDNTGLIENSFDNTIVIAPNPINDQFTIESTSELLIENVIVTNIDGKVMTAVNNTSTAIQSIDATEFPAGIYFLNITLSNAENVIKKVVK